ncbi:hypothetical protein BDN71DRAFT_1437226 [Pleurotus eryngii]|uniref:Uncharacterized protein n=1 Tax=Pleurotus eryngii TaxID=5323 RepID=A0A9P6CZX4_PLEER|nr:hypothetical protein BDN71DRAFT_1437226 [Pleurotus eryngii]
MWDEERNLHLFTRQNIEAAERLLEMTDRYGMVMRLAKGTPTLQATRTGNYTWVDNVWCAEELQGAVLKCDTEPSLRPPKTDHLPVITEMSIDMEKRDPRMRKNFRAADWEAFRERLGEALAGFGRPTEIYEIEEFERRRNQIEEAIQSITDDEEKLVKYY